MPEKLLVHGYRSLPFAKVVFLCSDHYHKDHSIPVTATSPASTGLEVAPWF